ncbi:hypothetical protein [Metabacillus idriensis]|uniref:hypothetical protein n=1 Tax=Metabacillus idriensis TaxID=324768 RepID=UPI00174D5A1D|nr:hypothetical protein [Metabacillus idriensis]
MERRTVKEELGRNPWNWPENIGIWPENWFFGRNIPVIGRKNSSIGRNPSSPINPSLTSHAKGYTLAYDKKTT